MTEIRTLIEAVEAGTLDGFVLGMHADAFPDDFSDPDKWVNLITVLDAFNGSVDAALALMEAVNPDGEVDRITQYRSLKRWEVVLGVGDKRFTASSETLARALLLANFKAMESTPASAGKE